MTIHAFTEFHSDYPAYVNASEQPDGTVKLSVRSRGNGGKDYASISLTEAQAEELAEAIFKHVYRADAPPTAPAATTPAASEITDSQLLSVYYNGGNVIGPKEELLAFRRIANLAAQVAANKPAEGLKAIAFRCPEINMSNYGQDEVDALQAWAFEIIDAIADVSSKPAAASGDATPDGYLYRAEKSDGSYSEWLYAGDYGRQAWKIENCREVRAFWFVTPQHQVQAGGDASDVNRALHSAVAALYFDDGSDFRAALCTVVRLLNKNLAFELLVNPKGAYDKACDMLKSAASPPISAHVTYATVRDAGDDEIHIECRMPDGQKGAMVIVMKPYDEIAQAICDFLNNQPT